MENKGYNEFLAEIKALITHSRLKAVVAANQEMLYLYWQLGKMIVESQEKKGWGAKVIDTLSKDLKLAFPDMKGFSTRNLKYMRKLAVAYPDFQIVQTVSAQLSWSHHIMLLDKFKDEKLRLWYVLKSAEQGWSHRTLAHQIELKAHQHFGALPNNFATFLPPYQSDLAKQIFKDEYIFEFITQNEKRKEKELEKELIQNITDFLLALGKGFSFVGKQFHLVVGGQDFYIDLLFYHFKIKCFVVIELKIDEFKPEYVGKLNFYLSVVDDLVKQEEDRPSIGLLLCKHKNDMVVEYALRDVNKPMGIAAYKLTKKIPENLKKDLPTETELKAIFKEIEQKMKEDK